MVTYTNYGPSFAHCLQTACCQMPCRGLVTVQIHDHMTLRSGGVRLSGLVLTLLHFHFLSLRPQGHTDIQPGFIRSLLAWDIMSTLPPLYR
jgi:hypothetical protein